MLLASSKTAQSEKIENRTATSLAESRLISKALKESAVTAVEEGRVEGVVDKSGVLSRLQVQGAVEVGYFIPLLGICVKLKSNRTA